MRTCSNWADIGYDKSSGLLAMSTRSRGLGSGLGMDPTGDADMNLFAVRYVRRMPRAELRVR